VHNAFDTPHRASKRPQEASNDFQPRFPTNKTRRCDTASTVHNSHSGARLRTRRHNLLYHRAGIQINNFCEKEGEKQQPSRWWGVFRCDWSTFMPRSRLRCRLLGLGPHMRPHLAGRMTQPGNRPRTAVDKDFNLSQIG
jgi:hypothetical protein